MAETTPATSGRRGVLKSLGQLHDGLTTASFQLAVACLGIITVAYCYEVAARYGFNAPTVWANPLVSYLLCATIFLALPEMTRTSEHININILVDALPPHVATVVNQMIRLVGCFACMLGAWITMTETGAQIVGDIWTISYFPVPKWTVSIFIPYGFASAGLYFLRQLAGNRQSAIPAGGL